MYSAQIVKEEILEVKRSIRGRSKKLERALERCNKSMPVSYTHLDVYKRQIPVLIKPDETLLECLVMNADPENDADCYEFDLKTVEEYRKKMLTTPIKDGKAVLEELIGQRREEAEDDELDWRCV